MNSDLKKIYVEEELGSRISMQLLESLRNILHVPEIEQADFILVDAADNAILSKVSAINDKKIIAVTQPEQITSVLLMHPNVIHGFLFDPVSIRVLQAIIDSSSRNTEDTSGAVQKAISLVETGSIVLYRRIPDHPQAFESTDVKIPKLHIENISNGELLYQGFSIAYEDGILVPLELGASWVVYSKDAKASRSIIHMAAGHSFAVRREKLSSMLSEIDPDQFIPASVFDYLVRKEGSRSDRFKRPYTVMEIHLPYDAKVVRSMAEGVLSLLRKSDSICEPELPKVRIFCPETSYFDAFWLVHRIQKKLQDTFFIDSSLFGALEKPTFTFWAYPESHAHQPASENYPKQLKEILFPAKREFWKVFLELQERFGAFLEPIDLNGTPLVDLIGVESVLATNMSTDSARIFVHIGDTADTLSSFQPVIRQKSLRNIVEISGYVEGEPPSSVHSIPFQPISDIRTGALRFYTYQSQSHTYMIGTYEKPDGSTFDFFCDDPWIVDLLQSSFAHTYFLRSVAK